MVCPEEPYPPTWGFAIRAYELARHLAMRHRVTLLTYDSGRSPSQRRRLDEVFESVCRVSRPPSLRGKRRAQLALLLSPSSYHLEALWSPAMQAALERLLDETAYDVVQVESSQMAGFEIPSGPVMVLDEHNIEHQLLRRMAAVETSPVRKLYGHVESLKARRLELEAWERFDGCAVTSQVDQQAIRRLRPGTPTCVVPNGVDLDHFRPGPVPLAADSMVFVGSINYRPNSDAAMLFIRHILPRIRRVRPAATFTVVGQGVPSGLARLAGDGVRFTGAVDDIRPHVLGAAVVVVPLRTGGGTRLKVLEGLAMGRAMVITSVGCEGLQVSDGEHLLIADHPEHFADQVLRLLQDGALRARLGEAGRALVEREYGWHAAVQRLDAFHGCLLAQGVKRSS